MPLEADYVEFETSDTDLLTELRDLESELHQPPARADVDRLDQLLDDSFQEFGQSGKTYSKADILRVLPLDVNTTKIWSGEYELFEIAVDVALLTYKAAHEDEAGRLFSHTLRSSLWVHTPEGWRLRFHQGTPTVASSREYKPTHRPSRSETRPVWLPYE